MIRNISRFVSNYAPVSLLLVSAVLLLWPQVSIAQSILAPGQGFVPCQGSSCSACDLVVMANTIIQWLMGVIAMLFAIIAAVAGWGLITSAGNSAAKEDAKKKFINSFIGLIIVLAAWLLVDTILLSLTGTGASNWLDVQCGSQTVPAVVTGSV